MREKRNDVLNETGELAPPVAEERGVVGGSDRASSSTSFKRPASSDGNNPASKKRSLNAKKLKKQKSLGKLPFRKSSVSRAPPTTSAPVSPKRATATPVYRASIVTIPSPQTMDFSAFEEGDDGLRTKVLSLENEVNSLRAKLRWFEQSYGEIPADTLADITTSPRKRKSAFKEEWGSLKTRGEESQILPDDIRELKGTAIDPILEESSPQGGADPESTIKLIPASPSAKSVPASSPRRSPTKMTSVFSPGQDEITVLETLSPIHPNIMRPRVGFAEIGVEQENLGNKY